MRFAVNSQFFLDPDAWDFLVNNVVPGLVGESGALNCWSAGCYTGKEPFSLAMALAEGHPTCRPKILATDRDDSPLSVARAGGPYSARDVAFVPSDWRAQYFHERSGEFFVRSNLRETVEFRSHDLLRDAYPIRFAVILYRNLEPCFSPQENSRVWEGFHASLRAGGVIFTGATDRVPSSQTQNWSPLGPCLHRRSE